MNMRTGKEATMWERGFAPVGFLVLLVTLFLSQFTLPDSVRPAGHTQRASAAGGVAPSPLSAAGDDLWFPASGHAERRSASTKASVAEGDAGGKTFLPGAGLRFHPFEAASSAVPFTLDDAAPVRPALASFRSRAPPVSAG